MVQVLLCLSEFLSKKGTHLLASSDIMKKNRNSLACLRNAGSYSVQSYCMEGFAAVVEDVLSFFLKDPCRTQPSPAVCLWASRISACGSKYSEGHCVSIRWGNFEKFHVLAIMVICTQVFGITPKQKSHTETLHMLTPILYMSRFGSKII